MSPSYQARGVAVGSNLILQRPARKRFPPKCGYGVNCGWLWSYVRIAMELPGDGYGAWGRLWMLWSELGAARELTGGGCGANWQWTWSSLGEGPNTLHIAREKGNHFVPLSRRA